MLPSSHDEHTNMSGTGRHVCPFSYGENTSVSGTGAGGQFCALRLMKTLAQGGRSAIVGHLRVANTLA